MDYAIFHVNLGGITPLARPLPQVGGAAFNAAVAFRRAGFPTIICGRVGQDREGDLILEALETQRVECYVDRSKSYPTCVCNITYFEGREDLRTIHYWQPNANEYDHRFLLEALRRSGLTERDFIFTSLHIFDQTNRNLETCGLYFGAFHHCQARLIVDIVPHKIYERIDLRQLLSMVGKTPFMWIAEFRTFRGLMGSELVGPSPERVEEPTLVDMQGIASTFGGSFLISRFGIGNISKEIIFNTTDNAATTAAPRATGYEALPDLEKPGFGDRLTADLVRQISVLQSLQ